MQRAVLVALATVVLLLAAVAAGASIPSSDGTITACVNVASGNLTRIIDTDAGQHCNTNETPVSWNQRGPAGPAGPAGPPGPAGGTGYEVVSRTVTYTWQEHQNSIGPEYGFSSNPVPVSCPEGKRATGYEPTPTVRWMTSPPQVWDGNQNANSAPVVKLAGGGTGWTFYGVAGSFFQDAQGNFYDTELTYRITCVSA